MYIAVCSDPIPGGCNLELPLQNDPNLYLTSSTAQTHIEFAYGDVNISEPCGSSLQHSAPIYDVYQMYLSESRLSEEAFFDTITQMLKPQDISDAARWVRFRFTLYVLHPRGGVVLKK